MRKLLLILLLLCCVVPAANAQDVRKFFIEAPDSVLPLLPRNSRADCIDFADAGMQYPVANLLDGKCVIKEISDDYILLQTSGISTMQMKLLPNGEDFLVCVVNTVFAESADSRIAFFDSAWKRLDDKSLFMAPAIKDFFMDVNGCNKTMESCDIYLVTLKLDKEDYSLVAEYTMPLYMSAAEASKVQPALKRLVYRWNGVRFVME